MSKLITTIRTTTTITVDTAEGTPSAEAVQAGTSSTTFSDTVTVYSFDELSPEAQERVIDREREHREQAWDTHDRDEIAMTIVYGLAEKLGTPGREEHGEQDYPGIDGVELDGWDLDRGSIAVSGQLTRENAPALPWIDSVGQIELTSKRSNYTIVSPVDAEAECTCPTDQILAPHEPGCLAIGVAIHDMVKYRALTEAVDGALSAALIDGRNDWEYRTGEEAARERIESEDDLFTEDGQPHV
jgi:hypothetical protein